MATIERPEDAAAAPAACHESRADGLQANVGYLDALYAQWQRAPESLPEAWRYFFDGFELASCGRPCVAGDQARAQAAVGNLIESYRRLGHLSAWLDPLASPPATVHPELALEAFGLSAEHLDQVFDASALHGPPRATLREIVEALRATYCGTIGVEYRHIQDAAARRWLEEAMEPGRNRPSLDRERRLSILADLIDAELFEAFLNTHYPGQKRFSLEGAETMMPAVHALVNLAADLGVEMLLIGMPHRGRLNVLANILGRSYTSIFSEFEDVRITDYPGGDGDVKYHRGYTSRHDGRITVSMTSNPSHLEAVNPVVEGRARAWQWRLDDREERRRVVPLLIHGDAAFAGQGLVAETLNLSQLEGYRTGGTVHLVVNNQIGFTASPTEARSSRYATDMMKMIEAPIFHVNGDDPEAVVHVTELALRFRQRFGRDVAIDMVCYRRHGHSEVDDPAFTQPLLYQKIKAHPSPRTLYADRLVEGGVLTRDEALRLESDFGARLTAAFESVRDAERECVVESCDDDATELDERVFDEVVDTRVDRGALAKVARALTTVPPGFSLTPKIAKRLPAQLAAVESGGTVDWGFAELLAIGSLLREGTPVRLSGQDSIRGTFSQRHARWYDVRTAEPYTPLSSIGPGQARFCVYNSSLTEAAVLGFDYGYSLEAPEMLVIWEAQFGDFANGAQVIIDQFVVSSQAKWQRTSGLVMLLPHGHEGQGPEHSNAHLERYLMACAGGNVQVCDLTTPAQYFHALRRQVRRSFRRPLILMAPKSMLRHPRAVSGVDELIEGTFREVLDDPAAPAEVETVVLCSGKVYYDLLEAREAASAGATALVRLEQLAPFPRAPLADVARRYGAATRVVWAQEEPQNKGAYRVIRPDLEAVFAGRAVEYVGRPASASPATGHHAVHVREQQELVARALGAGAR
jgi:2-oxoglutarate dehydrogenase E1 component